MFRFLARGARRARHFNQTLRAQGVPFLARMVLVAQKVKGLVLPKGTRRLASYEATIGRVSGPILRYGHRAVGTVGVEGHADLDAAAGLVFEEVEVLEFVEHEEPVVSIFITVF